MTDTYLRSLGFAPTNEERDASRPAFSRAWRYQHSHLATDGTPLFAESPLGMADCRLSALPAPLAAADLVARLPADDLPGLARAVQAFFAAHGGQGEPVKAVVPLRYGPARQRR